MIDTNQHFIYVWKESKFGLPFYIGQGRHAGYKITNAKRYKRSVAIHYNGKKSKDVLAYCQLVFNKLLANGITPVVEILYDNLTLDEANNMEVLLIKRLGRRNTKTGILCNLTDGGTQNPMDDPNIRAKHKEILESEAYLSKQNCKSITINGFEYYSKREASRKLGISRKMINKYLKCQN